MGNILEEIIAFKKLEIEYSRKVFPINQLKDRISLRDAHYSMKKRLMMRQGSGVIAEFKRRSPSEKQLNPMAKVEDVVSLYEKSNCTAISVITDERFFGGSLKDLERTRKLVSVPILRKDFIVDGYQLYEAKANGADAILLIASCLSKKQIHDLAHHARAVGVEVLLEIHTEEELDKMSPFVDIVGVNNRDLKRFETDIQTSLSLFDFLPKNLPKISESGIHTPEKGAQLMKAGFDGLLIGTSFMKTENPGESCIQFTSQLEHEKSLIKHEIQK